ncbi:MAG TPA: hypothetical protein VFP44_13505 [Usitatibacter sp.]|nr:hypothetical protein [Usitatibacter sp.]
MTYCDAPRIHLATCVQGALPRRLAFSRWPPRYGAEREASARLAAEESLCEIADRLAHAAPVGLVEERRRCVRLWSIIEISISTQGSDLRARYLEPVREIPALTVDLRHPLSTTAWIQAFAPVMRQAYERRGWLNALGTPTDIWIRGVVRSSFRHCLDFSTLRRQALEFLRPDPLTLSLVKRLFPDPRIGPQPFNWAGMSREPLALVAIERPRLLPFLFPLSSSGCPAPDDPVHEIERVYLDHGMEPRAFPKLERWGWDVFRCARGSAVFSDGPRVVVEVANALHRIGVTEQPPDIFGHLITHGLDVFWSEEGLRHIDEALPDWFLHALYPACASDDDEDHINLQEQFIEACFWLRNAQPEPDANQRRAGWRWIVTQSERYARESAQEASKRWNVPFEDFTEGPYRIVALRDAAELVNEASAMSNCLAGYDEACASGSVAVLSIRLAATGERVACLSAERRIDVHAKPYWKLDELKGPRNSDASRLLPLAQRAVRRLDKDRP